MLVRIVHGAIPFPRRRARRPFLADGAVLEADTVVGLDVVDAVPSVVDLPGWAPGPERSAAWEGPGRLRLVIPARSGLAVRLPGPSR